ncbi:unnamed protein product [Lepidochelys olivacea]
MKETRRDPARRHDPTPAPPPGEQRRCQHPGQALSRAVAAAAGGGGGQSRAGQEPLQLIRRRRRQEFVLEDISLLRVTWEAREGLLLQCGFHPGPYAACLCAAMVLPPLTAQWRGQVSLTGTRPQWLS